MKKIFDVIAIGRSGVDIYAEQIGARLEDVYSFKKYLGGSPTNTMTCAARLGLKTGLITRVGDEHMGRFIKETLEKEQVDTSFVITDKKRLTNLVLLGLKDKDTFPLIFFRENCADMNLSTQDIDENYIQKSNCILISGTHLSTEQTTQACEKMLKVARQSGIKTVLDIDYRPVLWGLTGKGEGENRFIKSEAISEHLQKFLPFFDLIVGTEEEIHIAGGNTNTIQALHNIRKTTQALLVMKLGSEGCVLIKQEIPKQCKDLKIYRSFQVDVFNVLGAGDGFMGGLLRGWLKNENWETTFKYANGCGALAVSRHGCTPAYPSFIELEYFIKNFSHIHFEVRKDKKLNQLHWSTATRKTKETEILAFAFDHRIQLEEIITQKEKITHFKRLCFEVVKKAKKQHPERTIGFLCDDRYGLDILNEATGQNFWIARPVELPKSFPLEFEGGESLGTYLREVPNQQCIKCLFTHHPKDDLSIKQQEIVKLKELFKVCRDLELELLLEAIPNKKYPYKIEDLITIIQSVYEAGIYPDWWKLESQTTEKDWKLLENLIRQKDPYCKGILVLGLAAPINDIIESLKIANRISIIKGFAIGRTIFYDIAKNWFYEQNDQKAIKKMFEILNFFIKNYLTFKE